jgi:hypothetical protein
LIQARQRLSLTLEQQRAEAARLRGSAPAVTRPEGEGVRGAPAPTLREIVGRNLALWIAGGVLAASGILYWALQPTLQPHSESTPPTKQISLPTPDPLRIERATWPVRSRSANPSGRPFARPAAPFLFPGVSFKGPFHPESFWSRKPVLLRASRAKPGRSIFRSRRRTARGARRNRDSRFGSSSVPGQSRGSKARIPRRRSPTRPRGLSARLRSNQTRRPQDPNPQVLPLPDRAAPPRSFWNSMAIRGPAS